MKALRFNPCHVAGVTLTLAVFLVQGGTATTALGQVDELSLFRTVPGVPNERNVAYVKPTADLNGDGYADYLVHYTGGYARGGFPAVLAISSGLDGFPLWTYPSPHRGSDAAAGQADVGDFDGDGSQNLVLGWSGVPNPGDSGRGLIIAQTVDGARTFWTREADDGVWSFGMGLSVPGDVTGEGIDDILVVAQWAEGSPPNAGRVYLLSGRDGSDVYVYTGTIGGEGLGQVIHQGVGDVDGDDYVDFAVSSQHRQNLIWIYSGADGSLIWEITDPDETLGAPLAAPGDLDGDGLDDVVYPIEDRVVAASVTDQRVLWEFFLPGLAGMRLNTIRDVDHDGVDDVLVSHPNVRFEDRPFGAVIAVSGRTGQELWRLRDPEMTDDVDLFAIYARDLGDVNGDGLADLAVRRRMAFGRDRGSDDEALIFTRNTLRAVPVDTGPGRVDLRLHVPSCPGRLYALLFAVGKGWVPLGSHRIPLAADWLFLWSVANPLFGVLDSKGEATIGLGSHISFPGGATSAELSCAGIVFDPAAPFGVRTVTNRVVPQPH